MSKVLIKVIVPAIQEEYELFIPVTLPIQELMPVLTNSIKTVSDNRYIVSGQEMLCGRGYSKPYDKRQCLSAYNITNGDEIFLI